MNILNIDKLVVKIVCFLALSIAVWTGCEKNFLNEVPKDELSETIFWKSESDAHRALIGVYRTQAQPNWYNTFNGWNIPSIFFAKWTDIATDKLFASNTYPTTGIQPTNGEVAGMWKYNYKVIANCNYFLGNIGKVEMSSKKKEEMIAEVKFLRSYSYFWLSQLYGRVPLVKKVLTFDKANSIKQNSKEEVMDFAIAQLSEAAKDLPIERPSSEEGRVEKGAALALKGRFLMAEERWSDAVATYEKIMKLGKYAIDPRFKKLFEDEGDNSKEIIFARKYTENKFGQSMSIQDSPPSWVGKYGEPWFTQNFIDKFLMIDGKTIEESPLYDPDNPFENRDPRLYATVFLPSYTKVKSGFGGSKIYRGHPDSIALTGQTGPGVTGYGVRKWYDSGYKGDPFSYGGDYPLIRYAEVLLSRLESELEAGNTITQNLLDKTINKVRQRDAVNMPRVTETEPNKLRKIIRRERCVELTMEGGIRYWDLLRWHKLDYVLSKKIYGMKITNNPSEYNGKYKINGKGHIFIRTKSFQDFNYLWPIPQSELDVNSNLEQNPGY